MYSYGLLLIYLLIIKLCTLEQICELNGNIGLSAEMAEILHIDILQ